MKRTTGFLVTGVVLFAFGLVMIFVTIKEYIASKEILRDAEIVNATVLSVSYNDYSSPPDRVYQMMFYLNGEKRVKEYDYFTTNWDRFKIGEDLPAYYLAKEDQLVLKKDFSLIPFKSIFFSLFLLLVGWIFFFSREGFAKAVERGDLRLGD